MHAAAAAVGMQPCVEQQRSSTQRNSSSNSEMQCNVECVVRCAVGEQRLRVLDYKVEKHTQTQTIGESYTEAASQ